MTAIALDLHPMINPKDREVEVYRQGRKKEVLIPTTLSGEDVLPGFVLDLQGIF